jgi:hypothetical protein
MFADCSALTKIYIPESATEIQKGAFRNCLSLQSVVIGNGVKVIGEEAFANCGVLLSISIGEGVESIGHRAFIDCNSVIGVICYPKTPPVTEHLTFPKSATIYVNDRKAYRSAIGWSNYSKQIKRIK